MKEELWNQCICGHCDMDAMLSITDKGMCSRCKKLSLGEKNWRTNANGWIKCNTCSKYEKNNKHPRPLCKQQLARLGLRRRRQTKRRKDLRILKELRQYNSESDMDDFVQEEIRKPAKKCPKVKEVPSISYQTLREAAMPKSSNPFVPKFTLELDKITFPSGTYPLQSLFAVAEKIRPEVPGTGFGTEEEDHLERAFAWRQQWDEDVIKELEIDTKLSPEQIQQWLQERKERDETDPPEILKSHNAKVLRAYRQIWLLFNGEIEEIMFEKIAKWLGCTKQKVNDMVNTPGHMFDLLRETTSRPPSYRTNRRYQKPQ